MIYTIENMNKFKVQHWDEDTTQWRFNDFSILLSSNNGLYSNGIDTYEVMLPGGDVDAFVPHSTLNRWLIESQLDTEQAIQQFPEYYV